MVTTAQQRNPRDYDNMRPGHFLAGYGLFQVWPDFPGEEVQYGKYFLRWYTNQNVKSTRRNFYSQSKCEIRIEGEQWVEYKHYYYRSDRPGPKWYIEKELRAEIAKVRKNFLRQRANTQAKARRIADKEKAEEAGQTLEEYKTTQRKAKAVKATKKKNAKLANKMVKQLNSKMKVAVVLKDLRDATATLQGKLEDTECDLVLSYVGSRIHRITEATRILERWTDERKKK